MFKKCIVCKDKLNQQSLCGACMGRGQERAVKKEALQEYILIVFDCVIWSFNLGLIIILWK